MGFRAITIYTQKSGLIPAKTSPDWAQDVDQNNNRQETDTYTLCLSLQEKWVAQWQLRPYLQDRNPTLEEGTPPRLETCADPCADRTPSPRDGGGNYQPPHPSC